MLEAHSQSTECSSNIGKRLFNLEHSASFFMQTGKILEALLKLIAPVSFLQFLFEIRLVEIMPQSTKRFIVYKYCA